MGWRLRRQMIFFKTGARSSKRHWETAGATFVQRVTDRNSASDVAQLVDDTVAASDFQKGKE